MSNVDRIAELIAERVGSKYDDLPADERLYIYAQAMLLDMKGVNISLTVDSEVDNGEET